MAIVGGVRDTGRLMGAFSERRPPCVTFLKARVTRKCVHECTGTVALILNSKFNKTIG